MFKRNLYNYLWKISIKTSKIIINACWDIPASLIFSFPILLARQSTYGNYGKDFAIFIRIEKKMLVFSTNKLIDAYAKTLRCSKILLVKPSDSIFFEEWLLTYLKIITFSETIVIVSFALLVKVGWYLVNSNIQSESKHFVDFVENMYGPKWENKPPYISRYRS